MKYFLVLSVLVFSNSFAFDHTHSQWSKVLANSTQKFQGMLFVNYKKIKQNPTELNKYLSQISKLKKKEFKSFSKQQKLAFWINVYNAFTVKLIIDNYPLSSIKDIKGAGGFLGIGATPWKIKFIPLFKEKISLDHIEHEIIRKEFQEPRIHFAVNCASIGCPSLATKAYTAENLDSLLDQMGYNFLINQTKNKFDENNKKAFLSKIFSWYGSDFNRQYGSYLKFIQLVLPQYKNLSKYDVEFLDYDWKLNSTDSIPKKE